MGDVRMRGAAAAAVLLGVVSSGPSIGQERPDGPPPYRVLGEATGEPEGERRGRYVAVRRGDTLGKIADRAGVPLSAVTAANPDAEPRKLMPGDLIEIPASSDDQVPGEFECPGDPRC